MGVKEPQRFERSYNTVVFMENSGSILEIFIDPKHSERVNGPEAKGLKYVVFAVESLEEVMGIVESQEMKTDWFGRKFTFTKDLDGS